MPGVLLEITITSDLKPRFKNFRQHFPVKLFMPFSPDVISIRYMISKFSFTVFSIDNYTLQTNFRELEERESDGIQLLVVVYS